MLVGSEAGAVSQRMEMRAEMFAIVGVVRIISSWKVKFDCLVGSQEDGVMVVVVVVSAVVWLIAGHFFTRLLSRPGECSERYHSTPGQAWHSLTPIRVRIRPIC